MRQGQQVYNNRAHNERLKIYVNMIENFWVGNRKRYDEDLQESFHNWSCMQSVVKLQLQQKKNDCCVAT